MTEAFQKQIEQEARQAVTELQVSPKRFPRFWMVILQL